MKAAIACPVCSGPIGMHVVRPEFTCHHCSWALSANIGTAFVRGVVAGVVATLVTLGLALFLPFPPSAVVIAWFQVGPFIGLAVGAGVYRTVLRLTPLRPQARSNMSIDTDPQQQEAASPRVLVVRSFLR